MSLVDYSQLFLRADNARNNGRVAEAIRYYRDIAEIANERPDEAKYRAQALQMSGASLNSTLTPERQSGYRDSVSYLERALRIYQQLGDETGVGATYRDLGIAASKMGDSAAENYFTQAVATLEKTDAPAELAITHDKFGLYLLKTGETEKALKQINQALMIFAQAEPASFFYATTLYDQARALLIAGQKAEALDAAQMALSWFGADHGQRQYQERITELTGLVGTLQAKLEQNTEAKKTLEQFTEFLAELDPAVAEALKRELQQLVDLTA